MCFLLLEDWIYIEIGIRLAVILNLAIGLATIAVMKLGR